MNFYLKLNFLSCKQWFKVVHNFSDPIPTNQSNSMQIGHILSFILRLEELHHRHLFSYSSNSLSAKTMTNWHESSKVLWPKQIIFVKKTLRFDCRGGFYWWLKMARKANWNFLSYMSISYTPYWGWISIQYLICLPDIWLILFSQYRITSMDIVWMCVCMNHSSEVDQNSPF